MPDTTALEDLGAADLHRRIASLEAELSLLRAHSGSGRARPDGGTEPSREDEVKARLAASRAALRDTDGWYELVCESATDYAIITADIAGRITGWNVGAGNLMQWPEAEAVGQELALIFTPEDRATRVPEQEMARARLEGRAEDERWHQRRDGSRFWASGLLMPLQDSGEILGYLKILRDQTARREAEEALRRALGEKDLLMQEVHHRVKNSLQLVQNLLALQGRAAEDPEVTMQLEESAARVRTIAAIHDRLYRAGSGLEVDVAAYLQGLVDELAAAMVSDADPRPLSLRTDAAIWPAGAVPTLGLVLTELVTNALKYGAGAVRVQFRQPADGPPELVVEDEGVPPADLDPLTAGGLGLRLVKGLLRPPAGTLELDRSAGTTRFIARLPGPRAEA